MNLAQRSVRSSTYTISASAIMTIVQFVRSILLARLIAPEIFGVYAYVSSFVLVTRSLPMFGMTGALLHRSPESAGESALRTHFTISFFFNIIWTIAIVIAGIILLDSENRWILWVIVATQFADNLVQTSRTLLVRRVVFRRIALIDLISTLVSTVSALVLAWAGYGMWGLISTDVAAAAVALLGYFIIRPPWKPRLGWSKSVARYLLRFGQHTFLAGLISQILDYIDNLWTGHFLGKSALGYYSRAYTFSSYPRKVLSTPLNSVASGTYAELKYDHRRLSQAFFRVNALMARGGFLIAGLLAMIAPEFIRLVIGEKWLPMLTAFRLMLVFTLLDPLKITIASLFVAVGKPEKVLYSRLVQLAVMLVSLFVFGNRWGIAGVAIAVNMMLLSGIILLLWQARAYVQFSIRRLFAVPAFALLVAMVLARAAIEIPGIRSSLWLIGAAKTIVFISVYSLVILLLERDQIPMLVGMLKQARGSDNAQKNS